MAIVDRHEVRHLAALRPALHAATEMFESADIVADLDPEYALG